MQFTCPFEVRNFDQISIPMVSDMQETQGYTVHAAYAQGGQIADWRKVLEDDGIDFDSLTVVDSDIMSSNYNNHAYLVSDGKQYWTLYRDDSDCAGLEIGRPVFDEGCECWL